jgi:hypothetical protein
VSASFWPGATGEANLGTKTSAEKIVRSYRSVLRHGLIDLTPAELMAVPALRSDHATSRWAVPVGQFEKFPFAVKSRF